MNIARHHRNRHGIKDARCRHHRSRQHRRLYGYRRCRRRNDVVFVVDVTVVTLGGVRNAILFLYRRRRHYHRRRRRHYRRRRPRLVLSTRPRRWCQRYRVLV